MQRSPTPSRSAASLRREHQLVLQLLKWFSRNARDLPWRRTRDPYAIWISEIMLQQTQVKTVIPFYERWMKTFPNLSALAGAPTAKVLKLWEGLGYYSRARNLQGAAQLLIQRHNSIFPQTVPALLELPGIGRYTAGAIASIAFNQPAPILDGNVIRVLSRLNGLRGNPRDRTANAKLWALADSLVHHAATLSSRHRRTCSDLNQSLMELGALICTPRQPACPACPVKKHCLARRQGLTEKIPNLAARPLISARRFFAFVVKTNSVYLISQRPAGALNGQLWEFPNLEICDPSMSPALAAKTLLGRTPRSIHSLGRIKQSITRYRVTIEVYRCDYKTDANLFRSKGKWRTWQQASRLPFASAHRKILHALASEPAAPRQTNQSESRPSRPLS